MGDEVRDMALTARERADAAHRRIDSYNGQISRVGAEVAGLRTDMSKAQSDVAKDLRDGLSTVTNDLMAVKLEVGGLKTRTGLMAAIGGTVGAAFVTLLFGLILFLAKDALIESPPEARPPAQTAPAQEPVRAAKPSGGANTRSRPTRVRAARTETPGRAAETRPDSASAPVPASPPDPAPPVEEEDDPIRDLVETVLTVATGTLPLP